MSDKLIKCCSEMGNWCIVDVVTRVLDYDL